MINQRCVCVCIVGRRVRGGGGAAPGRRPVEAPRPEAQRGDARPAAAPGGTDRQEQSAREEAAEVSANHGFPARAFFSVFPFVCREFTARD